MRRMSVDSNIRLFRGGVLRCGLISLAREKTKIDQGDHFARHGYLHHFMIVVNKQNIFRFQIRMDEMEVMQD
jgi:hypothetical protein